MNAANAVMLDAQPAYSAAGRERDARISRGRPLIMLGVLAGGWVLARALLWETPLPQAPRALGAMSAQFSATETVVQALPKVASGKVSASTGEASSAGRAKLGAYWPTQTYRPSADAPLALPSEAAFLMPASRDDTSGGDLKTAASHQLMWMAAMAYMPVPKAVRSAIALPTSPSEPSAEPFAIARKAGADRWSLDAWTFYRQGSASPLIALGQSPSYGASQAGAVLRYELQPSNARRPRAYLRGYSSLEGRTEQEVAAGLSAKPLPQLPLRLHAEARALYSANDASARAAAFVTTEIAPAKLPAGFTAEVYGQAGYVTGKNSTAFADGQVHVLREVASFDLAKIEVGGAAFAGAQKGAHRADIGPAMRVNLSLGETPARLSASYRAKVAGDAQPGSGVAVTLSTRF